MPGYVIQMEKLVLNILSFEISVPTARTFLARFVRCASSDKKEQTLCAVSCHFKRLCYGLFWAVGLFDQLMNLRAR